MAIKGPVTGVRVLDLSQGYGGPLCGELLGDMGAEVIKIEPPIGEVARNNIWGKSGGPDILAFNRNKKGVVLDLWTNSGKEALYDLVRVSDVVLDNFRKGALEKLGADYDSVRKINPRIISASILGYGSSGPYSERPAYEHIIEAITGIASQCCFAGEKPVVQPTPFIEITAGLKLYCGILAVLYERERIGVGRRVEVNLLDNGFAIASWIYQGVFGLGSDLPPVGRGVSIIPVAGTYRARDGVPFAISSGWPRIARVVGMEWLIDDPRFSNVILRMLSKEVLSDLIEEGLQKADAADWLELLRVEDIPCSHINTLEQALEDPQVVHNKTVISMEHPEYGKIRAIDCPIKIVGAIEGEYTAPPTLGEHTEEVLKEVLRYSDKNIARLKKEQEENFKVMQKQARQAI